VIVPARNHRSAVRYLIPLLQSILAELQFTKIAHLSTFVNKWYHFFETTMTRHHDDASANDARRGRRDTSASRTDDLRDSPMMVHLLSALQAGEDIGHYGRLTLALVSRFFLDDGELMRQQAHQPDHDEEEARALVAQLGSLGYNPPWRERILQWHTRQDFPICPDADDPQACNDYRELRFPDDSYGNIQELWKSAPKHGPNQRTTRAHPWAHKPRAHKTCSTTRRGGLGNPRPRRAMSSGRRLSPHAPAPRS
jgi:hypothetical protein